MDAQNQKRRSAWSVIAICDDVVSVVIDDCLCIAFHSSNNNHSFFEFERHFSLNLCLCIVTSRQSHSCL
jgi:hypothetical protein